MMYALNLSDDGRILSATYPKYALEDTITVEELPEGDIYEYRYVDGEFIHDPIPVSGTPDEPVKEDYESRIAALEEELAAAKILLGVE